MFWEFSMLLLLLLLLRNTSSQTPGDKREQRGVTPQFGTD